MQKLDEYVKIAEAARILGVAQNTLRSWADSGKVESTRNPANGYRLFRKKDLEGFLRSLELRSLRNDAEAIGQQPRKPR